MQEWLLPYGATIVALGVAGAVLLLQLVVVDVAGILGGHQPGASPDRDPSNFFFRAMRAHANTNESISVFVILALFGVLSAASPSWLGGGAWAYVAARVAHMSFYYAGIPLARSISFGVSLVALVVMLVTGMWQWL